MFSFDPNRLNDLSRRQLMADMAKYCLGVTVLPVGFAAAIEAADEKKATAKSSSSGGKSAKHLIYLYMQGAMSQLDTFDPKPKSKVQGETKPIQTKISGVQFGEKLPELAKLADKLAVIRSMNTSTAAHEPARYLMSTSYKPLATTRHPGLGSWIHKSLGRIHKELPVAVQVGGGVGPGYLGAAFAPVPVGDPSLGLQNTKSPAYLNDAAFDKRMNLSRAFDADFRKQASTNRKVNGYDDLYSDAIHLLRSEDLLAFDINKESDEAKNAYGTTRFGKGCLLARRLVEHGVRYVEVSLGSWDHHVDLWTKMENIGTELDNAASRLIADLSSKGLLKDTLIVIGTEFGRKPEINQNSGRDHHPAAFSCVLAGGPIKGGQVWGKSDADAFRVDSDGVTPEELNATIAVAMGIPYDKEIFSPDGRPFKIGNNGKPITKLL